MTPPPAPGQPAAAVAPPLLPRRPGVDSYGTPASDTLRASITPDPLRATLVERVQSVARSLGRTVPMPDPRVDAVAEDLAWGLRGTEVPTAEMADFLASHYGFVEPGPQVSIIRASGHPDAELAGLAAAQLGEIIKTGAYALVGVGVRRQADEVVLVAALQEKNVTMAPVRRSVGVGAAIHLEGRLLGNYARPDVTVTLPSGTVRESAGAAAADGGGFHATVRCDQGPGRYQIEVGGTGALGPAVRANFPVYCGLPPPDSVPRGPAIAQGVSWTAAQAETRLLELVNQDRRAAHLPPLVLDGRLSDVARAHSRDMADHDFVGHVSPTTGDPGARVQRAGFQPQFLAENAALDATPDGAHAGLMNSPGHRANILETHATRIGIGVVLKKWPSGADGLLVTELFM